MFQTPDPSSLPSDTGRIAKFSLGQVVATPAALALLEEHQVSPLDLLARHVSGDWGELPAEDAALNNASLETEGRLLSSYPIAPNTKVWVITEWDRSVTTVLRPEDY